MGIITITCLFIFYSLCFCFYARLSISMNMKCYPADLKALKSFVQVLESPIEGWDDHGSSSNCCNWKGVSCNSSPPLNLNNNDSISTVYYRVIGLELTGMKLRGKISESLADLVELRTLNLSANFLTSSLPEWIFSLQNLQVLDLSSNDLSGYAPFNITSSSISFIDISRNKLTGVVDLALFCKTAKQIKILDLSSNRFEGKLLPGLGYCTSLEHLSLGSNFFTESLPQDLFMLSKLKTLDIRHNGFSGELSSQLGNLSDLVNLDVSFNQFSGWLPDVFFKLRKLEQLVASSNHFTGHLPVSLCNSPTISSLSLDNNSLSGSIDFINCSAMVSMTSLNLGSNSFFGNIESLSSCQQLRSANLARNNFGGNFPDSFKNLKSLSHLSVSGNGFRNLSAALTTLQHCENLSVLILTSNFHGEVMPANSNLRFENMRLFVIANCGLTGLVPRWVSSSTKLLILDLSWNNLGGAIPYWIGDLGHLFYLDLSNNSLSGTIPKSLTQLQGLIKLNISLEKQIFEGFSFYRKKQQTTLREYKQIWGFPPLVDLSYNRLSGPIWSEFGNLKNLHVLGFSNNKLSEEIPSSLSKLTNLELMDLSYNSLSGRIPASLVNLHFLSAFNVAYNHLHGSIPSGGQFYTFPDSSFVGNAGLCGYHSFPCQEENKHKEGDDQINETKSLVYFMRMPFPLGIGVAFGFISTVAFCFYTGMIFPEENKRKTRVR